MSPHPAPTVIYGPGSTRQRHAPGDWLFGRDTPLDESFLGFERVRGIPQRPGRHRSAVTTKHRAAYAQKPICLFALELSVSLPEVARCVNNFTSTDGQDVRRARRCRRARQHASTRARCRARGSATMRTPPGDSFGAAVRMGRRIRQGPGARATARRPAAPATAGRAAVSC